MWSFHPAGDSPSPPGDLFPELRKHMKFSWSVVTILFLLVPVGEKGLFILFLVSKYLGFGLYCRGQAFVQCLCMRAIFFNTVWFLYLWCARLFTSEEQLERFFALRVPVVTGKAHFTLIPSSQAWAGPIPGVGESTFCPSLIACCSQLSGIGRIFQWGNCSIFLLCTYRTEPPHPLS